MSESTAKSIRTFTPRPPAINQTLDSLHPWLMIGFQMVSVLLIFVGLFEGKRPEIGIMWLVVGWSILLPIQLRQQQRISALEERLSKLEPSKTDAQ